MILEVKFITFDEEAFATLPVWYPHQETEGNKHTAYQTNTEAALPNPMARPTQPPESGQRNALHEEINMAESKKVLREIFFF